MVTSVHSNSLHPSRIAYDKSYNLNGKSHGLKPVPTKPPISYVSKERPRGRVIAQPVISHTKL